MNEKRNVLVQTPVVSGLIPVTAAAAVVVSCCRTVQLLWHQLRVSVLVLKERLLQGLQDSNGNYTRQTDILQAFRPEQHQVGTRGRT